MARDYMPYVDRANVAPRTRGKLSLLRNSTRDIWIDDGAKVWSVTGETVYVKAFGAKFDGVTDDAAAIQAALDAANTAGGGTVVLPAGTAIIGTTLVMYTHVHVVGTGGDTTILKLKNSTNVDVIAGYQFASLTGLNGTGGIHNWSIRDLTIDGNKANNASACYGLRVYGYGYQLHNLRIKNCKNDGLWSEWSSSSSSPGQDSMEAHIYGLRSHDNDGRGVNWQGPHDSQFHGGACYLNATAGIDVSGNGSGTEFYGGHNWGGGVQPINWILNAVGAVCHSGCISDGATSVGVKLLANETQWTGDWVYAAAGNTTVGIQIGTSGTPVSRVTVLTTIKELLGGAIDFQGDGTHNRVWASIYQSTGNPYLSTPNAATDLDLRISGGASNPSAHVLRKVAYAGGVAISALRIDTDGTLNAGVSLRSPFVANGSSSSNARADFNTTGMVVRRNVGDTNAVLIANREHASSTGTHFQGQNAGSFAGGIRFGSVAPVNADGTNGELYVNSAGGAGTTIYQRRAGAWVGIV